MIGHGPRARSPSHVDDGCHGYQPGIRAPLGAHAAPISHRGITTQGASMGDRLRSSLLAGFIAGFIWLFITSFTTMDRNTAALVGLGFVIVGAVGTAVISGIIDKAHSRRS